MSAGHWHTPWHGAFEMTSDDLADMVTNFEAGVGLVAENKNRAPLNYGHDMGGKAAAWITGLFLENDGTELWGSVKWTREGARSLKEEEYAYISPEWNPRDFPWENPEVEGEFVDNVFTGAALTNIPLFKKLKPVMASRDAGGSDKHNEGASMDLATLRAKKADELTDEEKAFLAEHKTELTDDERTAFGLVEETADEKEAREAAEKADADAKAEADRKAAEDAKGVQASAHGLTASQIAQLQADAKAGREAQQELLKTLLTASVTAHIERGAIKSDQLDSAVSLLMASSDAQRTALSTFLDALPANKLIASAPSGDGGEAEEVELTDEDKSLGSDFGNTPEEIAEYKKKEAAAAAGK
ncbi:Mu-like prophage I protein [Rathayibacter sp. PhB127]|uniref:phage protease n=1 Tax=Rathayibacter sp. PhB127 TaxID=2485176 RepID=UPI000FAD7B87|nr:phage protease [Rathayibacter sp. PhB127]ROS29595.1 Mu-like prophage I protein [Rathayibacter sp. PhB127]